MQAYKDRDAEKGLTLLLADPKAIADNSFAQYLVGEMASAKRDRSLAERGYRRVVELHDSGKDPLPGGDPTLWAAVDGLALAVALQGRLADALPLFERGVTLARELPDRSSLPAALCNLACCHAELDQFTEAHVALVECLRLDPDRRTAARRDPSFKEAWKRPEFRALLGRDQARD
jgi:tetratricopeptide (TPR) repeat protein